MTSLLASPRAAADGAGRLTRPAGAAILAMLGVGLGLALWRYPPPVLLALAAVLALLGVLALALVRYELAVAIGIALFAVGKIEPAPPDAVFGVVIAVALVTGRFRLRRVPLTVGALIGAFLVLNIISAAGAVYPARAALFFSITLYLGIFSLWFTGYVDSVSRTRQLTIAYIASAVISALLGASAILFTYPGDVYFVANDDLRASGMFADPNVFGPFLIPAALILLEEALRPRLLKISQTLKIGCFLILVLGVVLSYSRAAFGNLVLAIAVVLVVSALRRRGGGRTVKVLAAVLVAAAVTAVVVIQSGSLGFLEQRAALQSYDQTRFSAQRYGLQAGESKPFGIGPGQFEKLAPAASHSSYIRALGEQGVLGFAAVLALFVATLIFAGRNALLGRDTYGIGSAALLGSWVGIMLNSFVVDTLHWRHLWFVAGLIWVGAMRRRGSEQPAPPGAAVRPRLT